MKAVIMAGGRGTRLLPLTCRLPKPMVPLLGKPVLEYTIELLRDKGFSQLAITTFFQPQILEDYFSQGEKWGVDLNYFIEEEPLGTAGSVKNAQDFLKETFLVMSGDVLTHFPLDEALAFHQEKGALATLILTQVENPLEYGVVMMEGEGRITGFVEKPAFGQVFTDTVNTGIYLLEPQVLEFMEKGERLDFSQDLFPYLLEGDYPLYGYMGKGYWSDIGNLEAYQRAHQDLMLGEVGIEISTCHGKEGDIFLEEGVIIPPSVQLEGPLYIGKGTRIEGGASLSSSVIGASCHIGQGVKIKDSILWDGVHLGSYGEVTGALLANHVTLGRQVLLEEGSVLGTGVKVGDLCQIRSGVKVWPQRTVEKKATLTRHLVKNPHYRHTIFGEHGACGRANLEITPEISCLLGSSFASLLPPGSFHLLTTDQHMVSHINGRALQMGILSTGNAVVEAKELTLPVLRYAIRSLGLKGGVHVHLNPKDHQELVLEFFDDEGQNLSPSKERELERIYHQGSLRRAPQDEIGERIVKDDLQEEYLQGLLGEVEGQGDLRILASHDDNSSGFLLKRLLLGMGCQLLSFRQKPWDLELELLKEEVLEVEADLGLILDHNGEDLTLITGEGHLLHEDHFQVLLALLLMEKGFDPLIFPVTAPRVIQELALGWEVILTGSHHHQVMGTFFKVHGHKTSYCPFQDGLVTLSWLLDLLIREDISLEELCYSIPPFYRVLEEVDCPWEEKGRLLRNLVELQDGELSLQEGVYFSHQGGTALILPHGEEPLFHIYTEAPSQREAKRLAMDYRERITGLL